MRIVTHVHYCHFTNFVDYLSIIAVIEDRWYGKYRVHHSDKHFFSTH